MRNLLFAALLLIAMPAFAGGFNGSGTYVRYFNWQNDKAAGIPVTASRVDTEDDGFATGLSTCLTKNGQTTVTANIPMSNFKLTGLAAGTALTDAPTLGQCQNNVGAFGADSGSANAYAVNPTPSISAYTVGQVFWLVPGTTNTTSSSLAVSGLSAKTIYKGGTTPLIAGDMTSGTAYVVYYDGTGFQLPGEIPAAVASSPSQIISGTSTVTVNSSTSTVSVSAGGFAVATFTTNTLSISGTVSTTNAAGTVSSTFANARNVSGTFVSATSLLTAPTISTTGATGSLAASLGTIAALNAPSITSIGANLAAASVNFAGIGSTSIRKSFNVSSVTRVSQGVYGVSFTTAMPDANYSVGGNCMRNNSAETWFEVTDQNTSPTTAGVIVRCQGSGGVNDSDRVNVIVFP